MQPTPKSPRHLPAGLVYLLGFLLFVLATWGLQMVNWRADLTQEKRYTLSPASRQLLDSLSSPVRIRLYLNGAMPADYQKLRLATTDFLDLLRAQNGNLIQVVNETPGEGMNDTARAILFDSLQRLGLAFQAVTDLKNGNETNQIVWPAALVEVQGRRPVPVDLRSSRTIYQQYNVVSQVPVEDKEATRNAAEALLEFKFMQALQRATRSNKPVVAYLVGNGQPIDLRVNDLGEQLRNDYDLGIFNLNEGFPKPQEIDVLLMVKPSIPFTDDQKLKLDQYVMQGGRMLWMVDKLYAELDSLLRSQADFVAYDRNLNLDDILFRYGVRINNDLVQDLNCAKIPLVVGTNADGSPRMQRIPWPYYPFLSAPTANPITQNLDRVLPIFATSMDTVAAPGVRKTVLLATDTNSRRVASPALVTLNSVRTEGDFASFNKAHLPVAVLLEGQFTSLYARRATAAMQDSVQRALGRPFAPAGNGRSRQIVVSDADLALNQVSRTTGPLPMGEIQGENYRFANREFFLNCVDYLVGNDGLFAARNKDFQLRLLDRDRLASEQAKWQFINLGLPLLLVGLAAWALPAWRRRRYQ